MQTAAIPEQSLPEALPTIRVVAETGDAAPQRVAALFRTAFASFDTLDLIGGEYSGSDQGQPPDATGFVLAVAPGTAEGGVLLELQSLGSGRVLLNRILSAPQAAPGRLEGEVASLVNAVAPMNGLIYGYLKQNGPQSALVNCLLLNNFYYFERTERRHLATYRCFEKLAEAHAKSPLVYAALVSLRVATKTEGYRYPENPSDEDTMVLARRAVQIGPTSSYAYGTMGYLYSQMGDFAEATHWMRKAHELNTFDLSMAAAYGYALVFSGKYREGASLLRRATDLSSVHPTWWDYCLFLAEFMLDDMDKAAQATNALSTAKKPQYLAARLIVAHLRGDESDADALVSGLVESDPKFAADPAAAFRKADYPLDLILKFVGALKVAGLGEAS
jgi:tetratricopeptide (TPR) repeat protein